MKNTVSKSLPLLLRRAMYNLRGGFLIRPLTIALVLGCAGAVLSLTEEEFPAWASQVQPFGLPTRPAKGQMVCVVPGPQHTGEDPVVEHVVRARDVYIIPRSDRRLLLGATVEDAGFDKRTDANTIETLYRAAARTCSRNHACAGSSFKRGCHVMKYGNGLISLGGSTKRTPLSG
jgi:hypothetical protein